MPVSSALMPPFFPGETGPERAGDWPKVTQEFRPELWVSPYTHPAWPRSPESPGRASPAPTWPKAQAGIRPPPSPSHHPVRGRCHTGSGQRPPLPVPSKTSATRVQATTHLLKPGHPDSLLTPHTQFIYISFVLVFKIRAQVQTLISVSLPLCKPKSPYYCHHHIGFSYLLLQSPIRSVHSSQSNHLR